MSKKITTIVVLDGKGQDGDKTFKRYAYHHGLAYQAVNKLMGGSKVMLSAVGSDATYEMHKVHSAAEKLLKQAGFEVTGLVGTDKLTRKSRNKGQSTYTLIANTITMETVGVDK